MIRALPATALLLFAAMAAERPNVVLIVSDDQGWRDFGFMGHGVVRTPHLDRLAETSAVFLNGYVPTALCRPSLATLLTGLYGHQHKITGNDPPDGADRKVMERFIREVLTLPRMLAEAGYVSLQTGKFWEGHYSNAGFTSGMTTEGRHGGPGLVIGRETMQPIYDFIADDRRRPFFIWYAPMMPHEPHNPPERLLKKYTREGRHERLAAYFAMVEWFDETCGQLLEFLDGEEVRDNTLVIFLVDNGWIQALEPAPHPSLPRKVHFAPKSKASAYDGGLRTPVLLRWPGRVRPGRYYDLVSTIDIAPTVLSACGLKRAPGMSGLDLLDLATGRKPQLERDAIFGEVFLHTEVAVEEPAANLMYRWVREGDWKLIAPTPDRGSPELYNVVLDAVENMNRAAEDPGRVKRLLARLDAWWNGK